MLILLHPAQYPKLKLKPYVPEIFFTKKEQKRINYEIEKGMINNINEVFLSFYIGHKYKYMLSLGHLGNRHFYILSLFVSFEQFKERINANINEVSFDHRLYILEGEIDFPNGYSTFGITIISKDNYVN